MDCWPCCFCAACCPLLGSIKCVIHSVLSSTAIVVLQRPHAEILKRIGFCYVSTLRSAPGSNKYATSETQLDLSTDPTEEDAEASTIHSYSSPATQRSSAEGKLEFSRLLLPAAPGNYRPYGQDGELGPDGKVATTPSTTPTSSMSSVRRGAGSSSSVRSEKVCAVFFLLAEVHAAHHHLTCVTSQ